ncbi:helix-turn-helix transcriptional regulator [Bacillus cereus]|uniref:HTH cro/C1-type domain-containing protein n=1 Tax=Bacillus paramycoides TaxID=2026194 RepID=A0A1J9VEU7_9BACI|nr:hypothetical protein [Bacillus thuringiensis]MBJ8123867.1 helix-turn-helix transcriptional regulator [Bacillus cereus]OJD74951.1 hypothetical protein BAU28_17470 [Bacillus paramycoides]
MNKVEYKQGFDYRFIKPVRQLRNQTQSDFEQVMGVDRSTIGKLERGEIEFTPLYQSKFKDAVKQIGISNIELISVSRILEMKEQRGYK